MSAHSVAMNWSPFVGDPPIDPLVWASKAAARRWANGQPMSDGDWEAIKAQAETMLREFDDNTF